MKRIPTHLASLSLLIGLLLAQPAQAAIFGDSKSVIDLRTKQEALQQTVLSQQARITELSDALARANGQIEQLNRQVTELKADQANGYKTLDQRLRALEPVPAEELAKQSFDAAVAQTQNGDYAKANRTWAQLLKAHPDQANNADVQYWYGVAQYGGQSYRNAITRLQSFVQQNPQDERVPQALLTIGSAQINSGQKATGDATLKQLIQNYPSSTAAQTAEKIIKSS